MSSRGRGYGKRWGFQGKCRLERFPGFLVVVAGLSREESVRVGAQRGCQVQGEKAAVKNSGPGQATKVDGWMD